MMGGARESRNESPEDALTRYQSAGLKQWQVKTGEGRFPNSEVGFGGKLTVLDGKG